MRPVLRQATSFYNSVIDTINHVSLPQQISKDMVKEFEGLGVEWSQLPVKLHVLNFKGVSKLHPSFFTSAIRFKKDAAATNAKVISINLEPEILHQVRFAGMEQALGHLKNFKQLDQPKSPDQPDEVKSQLLRHVVDAARLAMDVMLKTTVVADENFRETIKDVQPERFSSVAIITSMGPVVKASFRLYFETATLAAFGTSLGFDPKDQPVLDSIVMELLNIVYTTARSKLNNDRGYDMPAEIPRMTTAAEALHSRATQTRQSSLVPMATPLGSFYLEVEYV